MNSTEDYVLSPTRHALVTIIEKGFSADDVRLAWERPERIYPSGSHPGQWRVCGYGLCLVGKPDGRTFHLITVYLDRVVTPVREDQLDTPEGRYFAQYGRRG